ncbi:MAG TPA: hypothetical protein VGM92_01015, partial [Candidatus Kapabacteria bacterium]
SNIIPLEKIREISRVQLYALELLEIETLARLNSGTTSPHPELIGLLANEVYSKFREYREEIGYHTVLVLLTTIEALIKVDFLEKRRKKGPFRTLYSSRGDRVPLEEILSAWILSRPVEKQLFSQYKDAVRLRNWLAHGRYFDQNLGRNEYSIDYIYDIGMRIQLLIRLSL